MTPQDFVPTSFVTRDGSVRVFRDDEHLWHAVAVGEAERPLLDAPRLTSWCAMVDALEALGALDVPDDDLEDHDIRW